MKHVVGISLGRSAEDFRFPVEFMGKRLTVHRVGANGRPARVARIVEQWQGRAAAFGLGIEPGTPAIEPPATAVPVTTGTALREILQEWALRDVQQRLGHYFTNARVLFLSGRASYKLAQTMAEYTPNLQFADPVLQLGAPVLLDSLDRLRLYLSGAHYLPDSAPASMLPGDSGRLWTSFLLRRALREATVVVAPVHELARFGRAELEGKTVITSTVSGARLARLRAQGVSMVVDGAPLLDGHVIGPAVLDAMIIAATGRKPEEIRPDDYLQIIADEGFEPRILYPRGVRRVNRFAFVIHPLSQEYFKKVEPIELLSRVSPPVFMDAVEKAMAYAPPFVYSKITGIRSPTGVEAEGWLISVGGTPKEIMSHGPEFTYARLLEAARIARGLGAQIMGLGAFTKVVGDAGATVARRAPLPITTGNSYSASGALWAAHDAMLRLGLVKRPSRGRRAVFTAMVVGATGAIGSVCARILAMVAEELYLVSPETAKLLALKESILAETPGAKLHLSSRTDAGIGVVDMIVTATSGAGKKVLDILQVKPGCVITDVARPLDLPPEEVAKRPDVLVIESGEILLPGNVKMKNIGLPPGVAYACLAETIVLALEGRFESFTVGRNIEWERVREIYRMGLKHGMKLAAISGVNGPFTDADIRRVRRLALAARAKAMPGMRAKAGAGKVGVPAVSKARRRSA
jgi:predicted amino acid dehydrogenase